MFFCFRKNPGVPLFQSHQKMFSTESSRRGSISEYEVMPNSASPRKNAIDYTKFKTKLCRHFLMGLQCPFEDRCAFAHGHTVTTADTESPMISPKSATAPPAYGSFVDIESPTDSRPPSPPSYGATAAPAPAYNSAPEYPSRFRHDPYNGSGVVFGH